MKKKIPLGSFTDFISWFLWASESISRKDSLMCVPQLESAQAGKIWWNSWGHGPPEPPTGQWSEDPESDVRVWLGGGSPAAVTLPAEGWGEGQGWLLRFVLQVPARAQPASRLCQKRGLSKKGGMGKRGKTSTRGNTSAFLDPHLHTHHTHSTPRLHQGFKCFRHTTTVGGGYCGSPHVTGEAQRLRTVTQQSWEAEPSWDQFRKS